MKPNQTKPNQILETFRQAVYQPINPLFVCERYNPFTVDAVDVF